MHSVLQVLSVTCSEHPSKKAVVIGDQSISYEDLWASAKKAAKYLQSTGIKQGDRVCLVCKNSIEYVISYYGIWMAGAAVVAINTDLHHKDIQNIYRHSGSRLMIADEKLKSVKGLQQLAQTDVAILNIDTEASNGDSLRNILTDESPLADDIQYPEPDQLAAIIYTSGTTGHPKGVSLTHKNLYSNMNAILDYLPIKPEDRVLNVLPFFYSYGNSILHTYLMQGATIYLENSLMFPKVIISKLIDYQITAFYGVPSTYVLLLNKMGFGQVHEKGTLKYIAQAGGKMTVHTTQALIGQLPAAEVFIMYGQTEASARISYLRPDMLTEKIGSVGKAIKGVKIQIRDFDNQAEVQPDIEGELYVRGDNIMKGYWNDDAMTAETVINGWLKTGDIGYKDRDGYIFLSGRQSDMIKVSGHRISPLEIEEVIIQLNFVDEVAVVGVEDDMSGQVPKAVIKVNSQDDVSDRMIKAHCSKYLPTYKVPKIIEYKDELPKTASGKVKRFML